MGKTILGWALAYVRDGKRLTAAFIALFQLAQPKLVEAGLPIPAGAGETAAAWLAVVVLNLWSKLDATRKAKEV